jgi:hypothetical protein
MEHTSFHFIPIHAGLTAHVSIIKPAQTHRVNTTTVQIRKNKQMNKTKNNMAGKE